MKKVGLLFVVFVALALFVYFYEIGGQEERQEAKELEESLFQLKQDEITSLEIRREGSPAIRIDREGDSWRLKEPVEAAADQFSVDGLTRDITSARLERKLEEVSDLSQYGLTNPRLVLVVRSDAGEKRLRVGAEDFSGSNVYVQFEEDPVVRLTGKTVLTAANKEVLDWRDKNILEFDQDRVQEMELLREAETVRLARKDGDWYLEEPFRDDADTNKVTSLLSAIKFARVERFESDHPDDLSLYGLDMPSGTFRIREEGQDAWKTLELGTTTEGGFFARNTALQSVFVVKESVMEQIAMETWELRNKKVVNVAQDRVQRFVLAAGDEKISIGHQEYDWIIETPEAQSGKETATYKFWYPITDIEFESIETSGEDSQPIFRNPDRTVEVQLTDAAVHYFDFVAFEDRYYARRRDGDKWGTISKEAFDKVDLKAEDLVVE